MPTADHNSLPALELFLDLQSRWQRSEMSGVRQGIPRTEIEIEARARGIELSEFILDDFKAMESFILKQDSERAEAEAKAEEQASRTRPTLSR